LAWDVLGRPGILGGAFEGLAELALTARIREASNGDRLAPTRISAVLALEVWQARAAPQGNRNRFDFIDPKYKIDIPDSEFVLQVLAGTEVVRP
jgi:hypothetical protein